jgi:hypothetical protein
MDIRLAFPLSRHLGTLAVGLGCFPFHDGPYHPPCVCQIVLIGIRSLVRFGKVRTPLAHPVLYPRWYSSDALPK